MADDRCIGWSYHQFEPRYDLIPQEPRMAQIDHNGQAEIIRVQREKFYVRDICIRCGKTIERVQPA